MVQHWTAVSDTEWNFQYEAPVALKKFIEKFTAIWRFDECPGEPDKCFFKVVYTAHPKKGSGNHFKAKMFMTKMMLKAIT